MSIKISCLAQGPVNANCYIILDEKSKQSAIIDCSVCSEKLKQIISEMGIRKFDYILFTHGHFDHIMGAKDIKETFGGKIVIHEKDAPCLSSDELSLANFGGVNLGFSLEADILTNDGDKLKFGDDFIEVIHTPGHTLGCVCYKIEDNLFTGDTIFKGSVGRTDFPNGSFFEILQSVKKIRALDKNYNIYPGHEQSTTLEIEKMTNPYFKKR